MTRQERRKAERKSRKQDWKSLHNAQSIINKMEGPTVTVVCEETMDDKMKMVCSNIKRIVKLLRQNAPEFSDGLCVALYNALLQSYIETGGLDIDMATARARYQEDLMNELLKDPEIRAGYDFL